MQFSGAIKRTRVLLLFNAQATVGVLLRFSVPVAAPKKVPPRFSDLAAIEVLLRSSVPAAAPKKVPPPFSVPIAAPKKVPPRYSDLAAIGVLLRFSVPAAAPKKVPPRFSDLATIGVLLRFSVPAAAPKKVPPRFSDPAAKEVLLLFNGPAAEVVKVAQYSVASQAKAEARPKEVAVAAEKALVAQSEKAQRADNKVPIRKAIGDFLCQVLVISPQFLYIALARAIVPGISIDHDFL